MSHLSRVLIVTVGLAALSAPSIAQTPATVREAGPFLGTWALTLETPQGPTVLTLTVTDVTGKVAGEIGSELVPVQRITDVTRVDDSLILKYGRDVGGAVVPVQVTLKPVSGVMRFEFDMAGGQVMFEGVAAGSNY